MCLCSGFEKNGSPAAAIETDEFRTYFLIDIFCREDFIEGDTTTDVLKDGGLNGGLELTEKQRCIVDLVRQFGGKDGGLKIPTIFPRQKFAHFGKKLYLCTVK